MSRSLTPDDLVFLNLVAVRRFGGDVAGADPRNVAEAAAWPAAENEGRPRFGTPHLRAAALAEATLRVFPDQPRATALFALCAQLRLEDHQLMAPQGVLAGMIQGLAQGRMSAAEVARWLQDRAVKVD